MERPPARPEGALIRLAREAAGMSIPEAVKLSGVSKARWSQVETGYETRDGQPRAVQAKGGTLARMARAVGLTPERLEDEGRRPDAAEILREMLRSSPQHDSQPAPAPLDDRPPPAVPLDEHTEAVLGMLVDFIEHPPAYNAELARLSRAILARTVNGQPALDRVEMLRFALEKVLSSGATEERRNGTTS